jgi:hypothetical protein
MTDPELAAAWDEVHANTPDGWYVGQPGYEERYRQWSMWCLVTSSHAGSFVTCALTWWLCSIRFVACLRRVADADTAHAYVEVP